MENEKETEQMDTEWGVDLSDLANDAEDTADQPDEAEEADTPAEEEPEAENTESESGAQQTEEKPEDKPAAASDKIAADTYELKHLDTVLSVDRGKVTELAQKGLDYDRIHEQRDTYKAKNEELQKFRDENAEISEFLHSLAQESGMTPDQMMDTIRTNSYVQKGMNQDAARERVAREKAERKLNAANQAKAEQENASKTQLSEQEKRDRDIQAFVSQYPGIDPTAIPKEVWTEVGTGTPLLTAYQKYQSSQLQKENEQLKAQLAAREKNEQNRKKTVGTQKTGGSESAKDPFLEALFGKD